MHLNAEDDCSEVAFVAVASSVLTRIYRPKGANSISNDHAPHLEFSDCHY